MTTPIEPWPCEGRIVGFDFDSQTIEILVPGLEAATLNARVAIVTSAASAATAAPSIPKFGSSGCAGGDCGKDGGGRNE